MQPAPVKKNDNHVKNDIVPATYAMFEMRSCRACRKLAKVRGNVTPQNPNPSDNWRLDIAMSISSENEDSHEDRGPKSL